MTLNADEVKALFDSEHVAFNIFVGPNFMSQKQFDSVIAQLCHINSDYQVHEVFTKHEVPVDLHNSLCFADFCLVSI